MRLRDDYEDAYRRPVCANCGSDRHPTSECFEIDDDMSLEASGRDEDDEDDQ